MLILLLPMVQTMLAEAMEQIHHNLQHAFASIPRFNTQMESNGVCLQLGRYQNYHYNQCMFIGTVAMMQTEFHQ
jgi:hypothetical protein